MDLNLAGKVAVVTGAGKGIGMATTRALADEGARVASARRNHLADDDSLLGNGNAQVLRHSAADRTAPGAGTDQPVKPVILGWPAGRGR